jgi:ABC-2 type transport system permease protein
VHIAVSTGTTLGLLAACLTVVWWVFKTGWRIRC